MTSEKAKILIIENSVAFTGAFKSALQIVKMTPQYDFIFCIPKGSQVALVLREKQISFYEIPFQEIRKDWSSLTYIPRLIKNSIHIRDIIQKESVSLIHSNDLYNLCGALIRFRGTRIPLIYHVRLMRSSYLRPIYPALKQIVSRSADHIFCVSQAAARDFEPSFNTQDHISVLYDGMEVPALEDPTSSSHPKILYVGNFIRGKGQNLAIPLIQDLQKRGLEFTFDFIGDPHDVDFYNFVKNEIQKLPSPSAVTIRGKEGDIFSELRKGDIFLNCSESESFSYTTLEALYSALPVVVQDSGGPRELFEDQKGGFLFAKNQTQQAVQNLENLIRSAELRQQVGKSGQDYATQNFQPQNMSSHLHSVYQKLLKN